DERRSPKLDTAFRRPFEADAVHGGHVHAVRDRVRALDRFPGVELRLSVLHFFFRVPADRGWIENDMRALKSGKTRGLRVPLIPANEHADAGKGRVEIQEPEVAGREVILFEIERIVRDVHLAIEAVDLAAGSDHCGRVVIQPWRSALE